MKRNFFYLYAFIGIALLLSSAKFLKGNRNTSEVCTKACIKQGKDKINSEKTSRPELFSPLHFISIIN